MHRHAALVALAALLLASPAYGAPPGQTTDAPAAPPSGGPPGADDDSEDEDEDDDDDDDDCDEGQYRTRIFRGFIGPFLRTTFWAHPRLYPGPGCATCAPGEIPAPQPGGKPHLDLYGGVQSLADSDFATSIQVRGRVGWFGLEGGLTSFVERGSNKGNSDYQRLDLWNFSGVIRLAGPADGEPPGTEISAAIGMAGLSGADVDLLALRLGLDARVPLGGSLSLLGSTAFYVFDDDVRAREARAGVSFSIVTLAYRITEFDTGSPLRGPEIGLQWRR